MSSRPGAETGTQAPPDAGSPAHQRVLAALELREPDRVPTMDVMEEFANIYKILGKKPSPLAFAFKNPWAAKVMDRLAVPLSKLPIMDHEMDQFAYDRTAASVQMGYDATWVMHVPIWRFQSSTVAHDIYGRHYEVSFDKEGNLATPMYKGGLIKSPQDWFDWDKGPLLRWPERTNRAFARI